MLQEAKKSLGVKDTRQVPWKRPLKGTNQYLVTIDINEETAASST